MDGLLIDSERIIMQACIKAAKQIGIIYTQGQYVELIGRAGPDSTARMIVQLNGEKILAMWCRLFMRNWRTWIILFL